MMVPDAVTLQRCTKNCADLIRKADAVWVQPHGISHGEYSNIVAETRKFDTALRMFSTLDIERCATILAKADIASC